MRAGISSLGRPGKIIAAPVNYRRHMSEMSETLDINDLGVFLKAPSSICGPGDVVRLPYSDRRFDQEGELGVVIGREVRAIAEEEEALDAVFGYTCLLDGVGPLADGDTIELEIEKIGSLAVSVSAADATACPTRGAGRGPVPPPAPSSWAPRRRR